MSTGSISEEENYDYAENDGYLIQQMDQAELQACNEDMQGQVQKIQQAVPLLSAATDIRYIMQDYTDPGNLIKLKLGAVIDRGQTHAHRSRGDGSCFYRCYAYGLIRYLIEKATEEIRTLIRERIRVAFRELVDTFGYTEFTTLDIHENFDDILQEMFQIHADKRLADVALDDILAKYFNDSGWDNYIVCTMRMLTSLGLQRRQDHYVNFITAFECAGVKDFCQRHVEAPTTEADQVQILALGESLQMSTTVIYADMSPGTGENGATPHYHHFGDEFKEANQVASHITLLYRPGHYDLMVV